MVVIAVYLKAVVRKKIRKVLEILTIVVQSYNVSVAFRHIVEETEMENGDSVVLVIRHNSSVD